MAATFRAPCLHSIQVQDACLHSIQVFFTSDLEFVQTSADCLPGSSTTEPTQKLTSMDSRLSFWASVRAASLEGRRHESSTHDAGGHQQHVPIPVSPVVFRVLDWPSNCFSS